MVRYDGSSADDQKHEGISLIRIGEIDPVLFEGIHARLQSFAGFLSGNDDSCIVSRGSLEQPKFPVTRYSGWEAAYSSLLAGAGYGPVTVGITPQGFWETVPEPRFIFCSRVGPGTVALSLYRFQNMRSGNRLSRIHKEVIKGLGMALGISHCSDSSCILSFHWHDADFDRNTGVCESCVTAMRSQLQQYFNRKTSGYTGIGRNNNGVLP